MTDLSTFGTVLAGVMRNVAGREDANQAAQEYMDRLAAVEIPQEFGSSIYDVDSYEQFVRLYHAVASKITDSKTLDAINHYGVYLYCLEYLSDLEEKESSAPEEETSGETDLEPSERGPEESEEESNEETPDEVEEEPEEIVETSETEDQETETEETDAGIEEDEPADQEEKAKEFDIYQLCEKELQEIETADEERADEKTAICSVILKYLLDVENLSDRLDQMIPESGAIDFVAFDDDEQKVILSCVLTEDEEDIPAEDLLDMLNEMRHQAMRLIRNPGLHRQKNWQKMLRDMLDRLPDNATDNLEYHVYSLVEIDEQELQAKISEHPEDNVPLDAVHVFTKDGIEKAIQLVLNPTKTVQHDSVTIDRAQNWLSYESGELKGIFCNVSSTSITNLYQQYAGAGLFDLNIRRYIRSSLVDSGINRTLDDNRQNFWFLNNGIIIACRNFEADDDVIHLENFSIVNGGQTTTLIGSYHGGNHEEFFIPCKIVAPKNAQVSQDVITAIAESSNSQKPIQARDLKSNATEMVRLAQGLSREGIGLEIKRGIKPQKGFEIELKNDEYGQIVLSFVLQRPGTARSAKKQIFENQQLYDSIFRPDYFRDKEKSRFICDLIRLNAAMKIAESTLRKDYAENEETEKDEVIRNAHLVLLACLGLMYRIENEDLSVFTLLRKPQLIADQDSFVYGGFLADKGDALQKKLKVVLDLLMDCVASAFEQSKDTTTSVSNFLKTDQKYYSMIVAAVTDKLKTEQDGGPLTDAGSFLKRKEMPSPAEQTVSSSDSVGGTAEPGRNVEEDESFHLDETGTSKDIVSSLYRYMKQKGVRFQNNESGLNDNSPYMIMWGGSSIGYRRASRKFPENGIVFFCNSRDMREIRDDLHLKAYDNHQDPRRPYAIFIPEKMIDQAIDALKQNPANT